VKTTDTPQLPGEGKDFIRETMFTRKVFEIRVSRQKFKEAKQKAIYDRSRQNELPEEKLREYEKKTLYDALTGVYNPRTFIKKLEYELKRAKRYKRPLSLVVIALDGLDHFGELHGAMVMDDILKSCSGIVKASIRDVDIPARCGHDQLAVIFPETYSSRAVLVGERIREKIAGRPLTDDMRKLRVTASIGVVSFPTHAREENDLMSKALEFLEEAQKRGGDCVYSG
jgi:diguanylate cyclase (GGDEF)-like protein